MNIFFDVDYTLIAFDGSLRPYVHEVFAKIRKEGHTIFIWSGTGLRWEIVNRHNLNQYIATCYRKPIADYRKGLVRLGVDIAPDFVVDDDRGIVEEFGGVVVFPYAEDPKDNEMRRVYEEIQKRSSG